jgi:hypothetical protein
LFYFGIFDIKWHNNLHHHSNHNGVKSQEWWK